MKATVNSTTWREPAARPGTERQGPNAAAGGQAGFTLLEVMVALAIVAIALVTLESFTLVIFNWTCPITILARKHSDSNNDNFDIFLPNWLARHNKIIFGSLFILGVLLTIYRTF